MSNAGIETRIRRAGILVAVGLLVQAVTLVAIHPLAFVAFIVIGCPLVGLGILLFLTALLAKDS